MNLATIWILYFVPIPEFVLWAGKGAKDACYDCVFAQSFAWMKFVYRGKLIDTDKACFEIVKTIRSKYSLDNEVFRILDAYGFDPGPSNHEIARVCIEKSGGEKPIIAQWEVAMSIWQQSPDTFYSGLVRVIWPDPEDDYLTTRKVKQKSKDEMEKLKCSHPLEIAHQGMWPRAMLIIYRLGVKPIACIVRIPWAGPNSGQKKCSDEISWLKEEWKPRAHHIVHRWV